MTIEMKGEHPCKENSRQTMVCREYEVIVD